MIDFDIMEQSIPVNPDILSWARKTAGLTLEEVAKQLNRKTISPDVIRGWEDGQASPSYSQLEQLAYSIYKRPLALFFFPEPPEEDSVSKSFRTLPEGQIESLPSRLHLLLRQAKVMQLNLSEIYDKSNPASRIIAQDIRLKPTGDVYEIAENVRKYLEVDLELQFSWETSEEAFKNWREIFEKNGVFVFKDAFRDDTFSGFCLYDETFPLIYVNNSNSFNRQIFTLFHELAHILFGTGGVDMREDLYVQSLRGDDKKIEVLCNRFAGTFLVPDPDFVLRISNSSIDDAIIESLANLYSVSRDVILRKLFDHEFISKQVFDRRQHQLAKLSKKRKGSGGDYYRTIGAYLGKQYIERTFALYYQGKLSRSQLADYLGVKAKYTRGFEKQLYPKGQGAPK